MRRPPIRITLQGLFTYMLQEVQSVTRKNKKIAWTKCTIFLRVILDRISHRVVYLNAMCRLSTTPCLIAIGALIVLLLVPFPVRAEIYTYVDENGTVHFTNVPTDPQFKMIIPPKEERPKVIIFKQKTAYEMSSIASWADFFGLNPYEFSQKSASNTGSMTSFTAICATLSRMVGIPRGRSVPSSLGIITRFTGLA